MSSEYIRTAAQNGVFHITIDRPQKMNALTPAMHAALQTAFDQFASDETSHVAVVSGAGERAFCAGSDLGGFDASDNASPYPINGYAGLAERYDLNKPVIAMVDGVCLGGGFELALSCDIIVASERSIFGLPEPKVGLIAIGGGIHRLVRQIGLKRAMEPLLTGRNIPAQEGFTLGFVTEVTPESELAARVDELCQQIIANAPLAVQLTKELAMWGLDQPTLADALSGQTQQPSFTRWRNSEDAREGPTAFAQKRKPNWQGR